MTKDEDPGAAEAAALSGGAVPAARPCVQLMGPDDLDRVLAVEVQAYGHPWSRGNFADSLRDAHLAALMTAGPGGEVMGYCVAMPGVEEVHLLNLTVAPAFQRQGLGQRLLDWLEGQARLRGLSTVWLEVRASNARALRLYESRGFARVGVRRGYYPAAASRREDAVVMRADLPRRTDHEAV